MENNGNSARINERKKRRKAIRTVKGMLEFFICLLIAYSLAMFTRAFIAEPFEVEGESMLPNLQDGESLFIKKIFLDIDYGDIVILKYPNDTENKNYVKRVVGLGGDTVEVSNGVLYINGAEQYEPYIKEEINYEMPEITVPEDCCFVLGDNRNHSKDSHIIGAVPIKYVKGKVIRKVG